MYMAFVPISVRSKPGLSNGSEGQKVVTELNLGSPWKVTWWTWQWCHFVWFDWLVPEGPASLGDAWLAWFGHMSPWPLPNSWSYIMEAKGHSEINNSHQVHLNSWRQNYESLEASTNRLPQTWSFWLCKCIAVNQEIKKEQFFPFFHWQYIFHCVFKKSKQFCYGKKTTLIFSLHHDSKEL